MTIISTIFASSKNIRLGKRICLDANQELDYTKSNLSLPQGHATPLSIDLQHQPFTQLAEHIMRLDANGHFMTAAVFPHLQAGDSVQIVSEHMKARFPGALSRSYRDMDWPSGPGIMVIDIDQEIFFLIVLQILYEICPQLVGCGYVARPSGRAGVYHNGAWLRSPLDGWHIYFIVDDARRIPEILHVLYQRLWYAGHGWIKIGEGGSGLHDRSYVDMQLHVSVQPIFESSAVMAEDYTASFGQMRHGPTVQEGAMVNSVAILQAWEQDRLRIEPSVQALIREAKRRAKPEQDRLREASYGVEVQRRRTAGLEGEYSRSDHLAVMERRETGLITSDDVLHIKDRNEVPVRLLLLDPLTYHHETCQDPMEPSYHNGAFCAQIYANEVGSTVEVKVHSFAHGSQIYDVKWAFRTLYELFNTLPLEELRNQWLSCMLNAELTMSEQEEVIKLIANRRGRIPKQLLHDELKAARRHSFHEEMRDEVDEEDLGEVDPLRNPLKLRPERVDLHPRDYQGLAKLVMPLDREPDRMAKALSKIELFAAAVPWQNELVCVYRGLDEVLKAPTYSMAKLSKVSSLFNHRRLVSDATLSSAHNPTLFDIWTRWPRRHQYSELVFKPVRNRFVDDHLQHLRPEERTNNCLLPQPNPENPHELNLYEGLCIRPLAWDLDANGEPIKDPAYYLADPLWKTMRRHMRDDLCAARQPVFYFHCLLEAARYFFPDVRQIVSCSYKSPIEGRGKSLMAKIWRRIWGAACVVLSDPQDLIRRFNSILAYRMHIVADEAICETRDKSLIGKLKFLLTEDTMTVEPKGLEQRQVPNFASFSFITNESTPLPFAPQHSRRILNLNLPGKHEMTQETADAFINEVEGEGCRAYLRYLLALVESGEVKPQRLRKPDFGLDIEDMEAAADTAHPVANFVMWLITEFDPQISRIRDDRFLRGFYTHVDDVSKLSGGHENSLHEQPREVWDNMMLVMVRTDFIRLFEEWHMWHYKGLSIPHTVTVWSYIRQHFNELFSLVPQPKSRVFIDGERYPAVGIQPRLTCQARWNEGKKASFDFANY